MHFQGRQCGTAGQGRAEQGGAVRGGAGRGGAGQGREGMSVSQRGMARHKHTTLCARLGGALVAQLDALGHLDLPGAMSI